MSAFVLDAAALMARLAATGVEETEDEEMEEEEEEEDRREDRESVEFFRESDGGRFEVGGRGGRFGVGASAGFTLVDAYGSARDSSVGGVRGFIGRGPASFWIGGERCPFRAGRR